MAADLMSDNEEKRIRDELARISTKIDTILKTVREPVPDEKASGLKTGIDSEAAPKTGPSIGARQQSETAAPELSGPAVDPARTDLPDRQGELRIQETEQEA